MFSAVDGRSVLERGVTVMNALKEKDILLGVLLRWGALVSIGVC